MQGDEREREFDLFPVATPAWMKAKARARRAARRAHALTLQAAGLRLEDLGGKVWAEVSEAYFGALEQSARLF